MWIKITARKQRRTTAVKSKRMLLSPVRRTFPPAFRDERKEKNSWFLLPEDFDKDQEQLLKYLNHLLSHVAAINILNV